MKRTLTVFLLCLLLLSGCGGQKPEEDAAPGLEGGASVEDAAEVPEELPEAEPESENLFAVMPRSYMFCSGAGAWSTTLDIEEDGSFSGLYLDADMGDSGEGYPAGTRYVCVFSGKFSQPERVDAVTWRMQIESIELDHPNDGEEEFADDARYVYSGPYGLENAEELLIYHPDTPADRLPEEFVHWIQGPYDWSPTEEGTLGIWGIYNVSEELGFTMYPWV